MSHQPASAFFLIAALISVHLLDSSRWAALLAAAAIAWMAVSDRSPVKFGTGLHAAAYEARHVIDTKLAVYQEDAALLNYDASRRFPGHPWYEAGRRFRASSAKVAVYSTPGYFGFAAGPEKWVIDGMGLGDPLLARIPGQAHRNRKGGHYPRPIPEGGLD